MNKPVCRSRGRASLEAQPLLPPFTQNTARIRVVPLCCSPGGFCMTSKATILVLLWTVFVGALYIGFSVGFCVVFSFILDLFTDSLPLLPYYIVVYSSSALCFIFYPLSGYFADVCCGRFKTITASLALLLCSMFLSLISGVLYFSPVGNTSKLVQFTIHCLITAIIGVAGYSANFIQFGLDQLLDAPSHQQALFVHWAKWCYDLMSIFIILLSTVCYACDVIAQSFNTLLEIFVSTVILLELMLTILLIVGCCKRHWFYSEPGHHNPYKMVIKVLNFARKHDYPLQRSAFTYCDDERPSRLDFGKQRFGGPFTTEQVEDVKTFLRIVVINPLRMRSRVTVVVLCVCVCVCLSVTTLVARGLISAVQAWYQHNQHDTAKVFNSWISLKTLCSKVMVLFTLRSARPYMKYCSYSIRIRVMTRKR